MYSDNLQVGSLVQRYDYEYRHHHNYDQNYFPYGPKGVIFALGGSDTGSVWDRYAAWCEVRWEDGTYEKFMGNREEETTIYEQLLDVTPELVVNVVMKDREYGGPEEGGWYGNTETPERHTICKSEAEAEALLEREQAWCDTENEGRPEISSVLSEGRYAAYRSVWPAERIGVGHYE